MNTESKNAGFLGLCAIAAFTLTCMLSSCDTNTNTRNITEGSAEAIVWAIPDGSWEYCDLQLDQYTVETCVAKNIIEYTTSVDCAGSDFEVVCYYFAHQYECQLIEAQILTY